MSGIGEGKAALLSEPRRYRDREHLKFVSLQPCLVCGRRPSDAHHMRFTQPPALASGGGGWHLFLQINPMHGIILPSDLARAWYHVLAILVVATGHNLSAPTQPGTENSTRNEIEQRRAGCRRIEVSAEF
jgi:hypothetical protein